MDGLDRHSHPDACQGVAHTVRTAARQPHVLACVDLFAGAGGFSLAARNSGFRVVAAVELNAHACQTYAANLVDDDAPRLYNQDIRTLDPAVMAENHFGGGTECDVLLGGPPCQGFSVHRIKDAGVDDPRNELILRYFQFVRHLRPKVFLMENVPGLLWERHRPFLDEFYSQGQASGYTLHSPLVLDARDYGVPQRRKRVFVLGVREDVDIQIDWPPPATHGNGVARARNPNLLPWLPAGKIFETPCRTGDENDLHMNHGAELLEVFRRTPPNGGSRKDSGRLLSCHSGHNGHGDVYGRIDPAVPAPTMTTACINPSKGRFVHPVEHHGITLRQAARFQTFPDWFVFKGGLTAGGEQIGNAVPVHLGEVLLRSIRNALENWEAHRD